MLATSKIFTGTDGLEYLCIHLTTELPTAENTSDLYQLLDYIPTLNRRFTIVIDTRDASAIHYFQFFPEFLNRLSNTPGDCVDRCEVWVDPSIGQLVSIIQKMISSTLRTNGSKIEIIFAP